MTEFLWNSNDVAKAVNGKVTKEFAANGVSIDTRTLEPGDIYVAIIGDKQDGHKYVDNAFAAGAAAAIVNNGFEYNGEGALVYVEDSFKAMQDLGLAARERNKGKIIAITGSVGKTSTKELMATALANFGKTHYSKKSFNNKWGVPLSLANMPKDAEFSIFELGMNHSGEIEELVCQVRPHISIISTIEPVHIENFANEEGIADAKSEIFTAMDSEGVAILNLDNPHYRRIRANAEKCGLMNFYTFGEVEDADSRLLDCSLCHDHVKATTKIFGQLVKYKINIPGKHMALNSLIVLTVAKILGLDVTKAAISLKESVPVTGRGNRIKVKLAEGEPEITVIDETYNASPVAMRAAFDVFATVSPQGDGRRIAVLGDMLELGKDGPQLHMDLANPLLRAKTDYVFCCGKLMEALYNVIPAEWQGGYALNSQDLAKTVKEFVKPGDVVLVKGSHGIKMSYITQALHDMDIRGEK